MTIIEVSVHPIAHVSEGGVSAVSPQVMVKITKTAERTLSVTLIEVGTHPITRNSAGTGGGA